MVGRDGGSLPHRVNRLAQITQRAWQAYVERIAGGAAGARWWTAVVVTASSDRQAQCYRQEIERRRREQKVPDGVLYLVVPDPGNRRVGSGAATLHALAALCAAEGLDLETHSLEEWWAGQRVLMIHSGGESRRLPQYSLTGKLFTALPVTTPWGEVSTVFDETLALSTGWVAQLPNGLVVASGDVVLTFDAVALPGDRPGRVRCRGAMPDLAGNSVLGTMRADGTRSETVRLANRKRHGPDRRRRWYTDEHQNPIIEIPDGMTAAPLGEPNGESSGGSQQFQAIIGALRDGESGQQRLGKSTERRWSDHSRYPASKSQGDRAFSA